MVTLEEAHEWGSQQFGHAYTVERREFADGDSRTIVKHTSGWSSTCYVTALVWLGRGEVWVEYYEGDDRRAREIFDIDDFDFDAEVMSHFW